MLKGDRIALNIRNWTLPRQLPPTSSWGALRTPNSWNFSSWQLFPSDDGLDARPVRRSLALVDEQQLQVIEEVQCEISAHLQRVVSLEHLWSLGFSKIMILLDAVIIFWK